MQVYIYIKQKRLDNEKETGSAAVFGQFNKQNFCIFFIKPGKSALAS